MRVLKFKNRYDGFGFTVVSAVCVILAFSTADLGSLAWIALVLFFVALRSVSIRQAIGLSFLFGCIYGIGVFWWLNSVEGVGYITYFLVLAPLFGFYYVIFGLCYRLAVVRFPALAIILAPALWVSVEFARTNMSFLSLPWNLLGHTQHGRLAIIGISDLTGVYGLSFLLVMVNEAVSRWIEAVLAWGEQGKAHHRRIFTVPVKAAGVTALCLVFSVSYSLARQGKAEVGDTIRVALVQANTLVRENTIYEEQREYFDVYSNLTLKAAESKPDLIVWPASSLPGSLSSRTVKTALGPLVKELNTHLLVGGAGGQKMSPAEGEGQIYANSEFLLRPGGRPGGVYHKRRLVPFNEYLPLSRVISWPRWITTLEESYRPGEKDTLFVLEKGKFGVPICWESLFPDLFRRFVKNGANFMVNVTNEAWMGRTAGPWQAHAMNVFRAVENRVALARVSATGISAFIGPGGYVLDIVQDDEGRKLHVPGILVRDIPLIQKRTFYTMYGDVFAWFMIVLSVLVMVASAWSGYWRENSSG